MRLRVEDEIVEVVGRLHRLARAVMRKDPDLARQLKRAATSIGLNAAEGLYGRDGSRRVRLENAMCSGRETIMALRIAAAAEYVDDGQAAREAKCVDRIVATLYRLAHR